MSNAGKLKLNLTDVHGSPLKEDLTVSLRHASRGTELRARIKSGRATIADLAAQPDGVYSLRIDPPSYLPMAQFVSIKSTGVTPLDVTFAVDPGKVKKMQRPAYANLLPDARKVLDASDAVKFFEQKSGETLYAAFDELRCAGLLNIFAKTTATTFASGRSVLSYVSKLIELRRDRFFASVPQELREETKNAVASGLFAEVSGSLHHPPDGFAPAGSYKTADHYGNLQLTFFANGNDWCADIDIDDAAGLAHAFQVIRNTLTNRPTHPYDIHQILVHHQHIDPGYVLAV